jgi:hypothetical protein
MKKVLRFLLGLAIIPIAVAGAVSLYQQLALVSGLSQNQSYFLAGIGIYLIIHSLFYKPVYLYIVGHELSHVLFTWFCGGRVKSFRASFEGGSVVSTKSNFFITLGPYFFPIYTILVSGVYLCLSIFSEVNKYSSLFIFLIGFSWTFHVVLTVHFIKMRQPDILKTGTLFSISLIYIINLAILVFILSSLFTEVSFLDFVRETSLETGRFYKDLFTGLFL